MGPNLELSVSIKKLMAQVPSHEGDRDIGEKADIQMPGLLGPKEG